MNAFEQDLSDKLPSHIIKQIVYPAFWDKFNWNKYNLDDNDFIEIKYLNDSASNFSKDINKLPNTEGGIYIFYINFGKIANINNVLVYIGRAYLTKNENLRVRCRSYFTKYLRESERPKISIMFHRWKRYLHLKFIQVDDNDTIEKLEEELINTFIPHFNDQIPDKTIRKAVKTLR